MLKGFRLASGYNRMWTSGWEGVVCRHDLLTLDSTASGVEGGTHGLLLCPTERGPAACIGRGGQDGRFEMTLC